MRGCKPNVHPLFFPQINILSDQLRKRLQAQANDIILFSTSVNASGGFLWCFSQHPLSIQQMNKCSAFQDLKPCQNAWKFFTCPHTGTRTWVSKWHSLLSSLNYENIYTTTLSTELNVPGYFPLFKLLLRFAFIIFRHESVEVNLGASSFSQSLCPLSEQIWPTLSFSPIGRKSFGVRVFLPF